MSFTATEFQKGVLGIGLPLIIKVSAPKLGIKPVIASAISKSLPPIRWPEWPKQSVNDKHGIVIVKI